VNLLPETNSVAAANLRQNIAATAKRAVTLRNLPFLINNLDFRCAGVAARPASGDPVFKAFALA
jgi:hypothetical protein